MADKKCPECGGTGSVFTGVSNMTCSTCGGQGTMRESDADEAETDLRRRGRPIRN